MAHMLELRSIGNINEFKMYKKNKIASEMRFWQFFEAGWLEKPPIHPHYLIAFF